MLSLSGQFGYIHEPFNISGLGPKLPSLQYWFECVTAEHPRERQLRKELTNVLRWNWPFTASLTTRRGFREVTELLVRYADFQYSGWKDKTPLIKDPIALYSAGWVHDVLGSRVLVCIRHPAAFCLSLCQKGWTFDFSHFLAQPVLKTELAPFWAEIEEFAQAERPLLDQAILLWNCSHYKIQKYKEKHDDWIFIRNEDVSLQPIETIQSIYHDLGLNFNDKVATKVRISTQGKKTSLKKTIRDSRSNLKKWKRVLSQEEVDIIRTRTREVSECFYLESDW